jgi:predicted TIM-barrel fold metal-dependent hydrolase
MTTSQSGKIDVHAHFLPQGYAEEMSRAGLQMPDGMPGYPQWSPELALETYDRLGISAAVLSISSPGVHYGDNGAARRLARRVNEAGAEAVNRYPRRFGLFASLPMPDVEGSLQELSYALDTLHADGVELKTNSQGIYLGDPKFESIFAELHRRKAVVFVHPTSPTFCSGCGVGVPRTVLEFPFDTTRAVTNLIFSGTIERYPDIVMIVPHSGGTLPMLAKRISSFAVAAGLPSARDGGVLACLRKLYYDTANAGSDLTLASTLQLIERSHLVFGSDWPWASIGAVAATIKDIEGSLLLGERDRYDIYRNNALAVLPRFGSLLGSKSQA